MTSTPSGEEPVDAATAAWQVYAVAPAEFVATRAAWVKRLKAAGDKEGAKEVGALRKPSVAAAAVNALARAEEPDDAVERLREVGARLRHAQSALDAAGLASLRAERDAALADWVRAVERHTPGGSLTASVAAEVRDTAVAALADAAATEVVLSGTLTRALSYSGFGEVDLADAVARTSTGVVLTRIEGGRGGDAEAAEAEPEDVDEDADGDVDEDAADDEGGPEADEGEPEEEDDEADEADEAALAALRAELEAAEVEVAAARAGRKGAATAAAAAAKEVTVTAKGVEQARRLLAQAQEHADRAARAQESADASLTAADEQLEKARERRERARAALEEAEDA